jgi:hypothetical protein
MRHGRLVAFVELDVLDHGSVVDTEQSSPYACSTHAASRALDSDLQTAGTVGQGRRCAVKAASANPRIVHKNRFSV